MVGPATCCVPSGCISGKLISAFALQFCELTLSQCEELVATVLNAMAELA